LNYNDARECSASAGKKIMTLQDESRIEIITSCVEETMDLGAAIGKLVFPGAMLALTGELGAGKTYFVKGLARGLDVEDPREVVSPSFALLNVYSGRLPLYHFDLYRLVGYHDFEDIGGEDYLEGEGVVAVEWAEKILDFLPSPEYIKAEFYYEGEDERRILLSSGGIRHEALISELKQSLRASPK
jgi:tRNA threonylcarbamoyladenosine biosynthesis protein TsaE